MEYQQSTGGAAERGREAAGEVAVTAREQGREVAREAGEQTRQIAGQAKERLATQAREQTGRASGGLRQWSEDLSAMADAGKPDSPVHGVVRQVADGGRRAADYLDQNGYEGVVGEVQDFARRRPGAFLLGTAVAGFLIGRAVKATGQAAKPDADRVQPAPDHTAPDLGHAAPDHSAQDHTVRAGTPYTPPEPAFPAEPAYEAPVSTPGQGAPLHAVDPDGLPGRVRTPGEER